MVSRLTGSHLSSLPSRIAMFERWQISSMRLCDQTSEIGCLRDFMASMKFAVWFSLTFPP